MAVALALIGVAYSGLSLHRLFRGQLWWIALGAAGLAPGVAWIYLTLRLHRQRCRRLRTAMWATLAALVLIALGVALEGVLTVSGRWSFTQPGVVISFHDPSMWTRLTNINQIWSKYGDPSCRLLMLAILWAYFRRLTAVLPKPRRANPKRFQPTP